MVRLAHKELADTRAMEEQAERHNPVKGAGATPSMGLSQFRGGMTQQMKKIAKMEKAKPLLAQTMEVKDAMMPSGEYGRSGMAGGAKAQGHHLARHLHSLHGEDFLKQFHDGMMSGMGSGGSNTGRYEGEGKQSEGGASFSRDTQEFSGHMRGGFWGALAGLALPLVGKLLGMGKMTKDAHDEMKSMMEEHEKKYHSGKKLRGGFWGALASIGIPLVGKLLGLGKMTQDAHDELCEMMRSKGRSQKMKGSGRMVGCGTGAGHESESDEECEPMKKKKVKRVVSATDGRRKRAEVVKRVMAEKGMKMIEASKYVKQHGLY